MTAPVALDFPIPAALGADRPPEERGTPRDSVRLLVSDGADDLHYRFSDLPDLLEEGDLLVVNESETLPASLPARGSPGEFRVSLSTEYGSGLWVAEPRWSFDRPGPLPLAPGETVDVAGVPCRVVAGYPGIRRLVFLEAGGDLREAMRRAGRPIRYGYLAHDYPIATYRTVFGRVPGSAEMPSASRPFTHRILDRLARKGVGTVPILLHTGVSSLEDGDAGPGRVPLLPEPYEVPAATVEAIRQARSRGSRVVAVGTTVVRALEAATDACGLRPARGFTRLYLHPGRPIRSVDGLLTGFHEARSTHLALLASFAGAERLGRAYRTAVDSGYLWHEFGDSQLWLARS